MTEYLTGKSDISRAPAEDSPIAKHYGWIQEIAEKYGCSLSDEAAEAAIHQALAVKCARVLADAGVYYQTPKGDAGLVRTMERVGSPRQ